MKASTTHSLSHQEIQAYYEQYVNPWQVEEARLHGIADWEMTHATGMHLFTREGKEIVDFMAGSSMLNLGHNHPRILKARRWYNEKKGMEVWKTFLSPYLAALSHNLAALSPDDLCYPFFCNSGSEAIEGALKIASKYQGKRKKCVVYTDASSHGSTHAALSISGAETVARSYHRLLDDCVSIPFGNWQAFEQVIVERGGKRNDIVAIVTEAICSNGVLIPPDDYLPKLRELCDTYKILLIVDEVSNGLGRTGKMFSFEHAVVTPDIYTIAKSLGGGKCSTAAYVARKRIFRRAYGSLNDSTLHTTTFNGFGEESVTALECLNILVDEQLVENAQKLGEHLQQGLRALVESYPQWIREVRGIGLLAAIEFLPIKGKRSTLDELYEGFPTGRVIYHLLHKHQTLTFARSARRDCLHISPPLIVSKIQIDSFLQALDEVLLRL